MPPMEPGEALGTAAQVAVALAGFAGVVVAFRSGSVHEWHPIDKLRLRLLLNNSIAPLILSLFAIWLLSVTPRPLWMWKLCSAAALVLTAVLAVVFSSRDITTSRFSGGSKVLLWFFGGLWVVAMLLQIYNIIELNAFWPFFATITFQLITGVVQFVRLIIIEPHSPSP